MSLDFRHLVFRLQSICEPVLEMFLFTVQTCTTKLNSGKHFGVIKVSVKEFFRHRVLFSIFPIPDNSFWVQ